MTKELRKRKSDKYSLDQNLEEIIFTTPDYQTKEHDTILKDQKFDTTPFQQKNPKNLAGARPSQNKGDKNNSVEGSRINSLERNFLTETTDKKDNEKKEVDQKDPVFKKLYYERGVNDINQLDNDKPLPEKAMRDPVYKTRQSDSVKGIGLKRNSWLDKKELLAEESNFMKRIREKKKLVSIDHGQPEYCNDDDMEVILLPNNNASPLPTGNHHQELLIAEKEILDTSHTAQFGDVSNDENLNNFQLLDSFGHDPNEIKLESIDQHLVSPQIVDPNQNCKKPKPIKKFDDIHFLHEISEEEQESPYNGVGKRYYQATNDPKQFNTGTSDQVKKIIKFKKSQEEEMALSKQKVQYEKMKNDRMNSYQDFFWIEVRSPYSSNHENNTDVVKREQLSSLLDCLLKVQAIISSQEVPINNKRLTVEEIMNLCQNFNLYYKSSGKLHLNFLKSELLALFSNKMDRNDEEVKENENLENCVSIYQFIEQVNNSKMAKYDSLELNQMVSDFYGWLAQFSKSEKVDEVNNSEFCTSPEDYSALLTRLNEDNITKLSDMNPNDLKDLVRNMGGPHNIKRLSDLNPKDQKNLISNMSARDMSKMFDLNPNELKKSVRGIRNDSGPSIGKSIDDNLNLFDSRMGNNPNIELNHLVTSYSKNLFPKKEDNKGCDSDGYEGPMFMDQLDNNDSQENLSYLKKKIDMLEKILEEKDQQFAEYKDLDNIRWNDVINEIKTLNTDLRESNKSQAFLKKQKNEIIDQINKLEEFNTHDSIVWIKIDEKNQKDSMDRNQAIHDNLSKQSEKVSNLNKEVMILSEKYKQMELLPNKRGDSKSNIENSDRRIENLVQENYSQKCRLEECLRQLEEAEFNYEQIKQSLDQQNNQDMIPSKNIRSIGSESNKKCLEKIDYLELTKKSMKKKLKQLIDQIVLLKQQLATKELENGGKIDDMIAYIDIDECDFNDIKSRDLSHSPSIQKYINNVNDKVRHQIDLTKYKLDNKYAINFDYLEEESVYKFTDEKKLWTPKREKINDKIDVRGWSKKKGSIEKRRSPEKCKKLAVQSIAFPNTDLYQTQDRKANDQMVSIDVRKGSYVKTECDKEKLNVTISPKKEDQFTEEEEHVINLLEIESGLYSKKSPLENIFDVTPVTMQVNKNSEPSSQQYNSNIHMENYNTEPIEYAEKTTPESNRKSWANMHSRISKHTNRMQISPSKIYRPHVMNHTYSKSHVNSRINSKDLKQNKPICYTFAKQLEKGYSENLKKKKKSLDKEYSNRFHFNNSRSQYHSPSRMANCKKDYSTNLSRCTPSRGSAENKNHSIIKKPRGVSNKLYNSAQVKRGKTTGEALTSKSKANLPVDAAKKQSWNYSGNLKSINEKYVYDSQQILLERSPEKYTQRNCGTSNQISNSKHKRNNTKESNYTNSSRKKYLGVELESAYFESNIQEFEEDIDKSLKQVIQMEVEEEKILECLKYVKK